MLEAGSKAPDWSAPDQTGQTRSLSDYEGKWLVFWWYPKASTPGCTIEGQGFRDNISSLEEAGASVVGASFDNVDELKEFSDNESFTYPLISDEDKSIGKAYGVERTEEMPFYEAGIPRRLTFLIAPDQTIAKVYDLEAGENDLSQHASQLIEEISSQA